jgi:hypothetical protein
MQKRVPQHNVFRFPLRTDAFGGPKEVVFDSDFDSGNCARVD